MVEIRLAEERDLPALLDLAAALFSEDAVARDPWVNPNWIRDHGEAAYRRTLAAGDEACFLAVDGEKPIGFLTACLEQPSTWRTLRRAELRAFFVLPDWRGQRIGERLVRRFREWSAERGAERAYVLAYAVNDGALRFYQRVGFSPYEIALEMPLADPSVDGEVAAR